LLAIRTSTRLAGAHRELKDGGSQLSRRQVGVQIDHLELLRFIAADLAPMNLICEHAGLSERAIYDRTKAVVEYFGFSFDAPPPG
jgi:hypothetical protein